MIAVFAASFVCNIFVEVFVTNLLLIHVSI